MANTWSTPRARTSWRAFAPQADRGDGTGDAGHLPTADRIADKLESHYNEVQDFEFTIERGRLYCLQTRNGKMNARAMVRTSVEMFKEGLITKERALQSRQPAPARATPGARS